MKYKRICLDLDGTLFEDEKNVDKLFLENIELKPIKNASEATNKLKSLGFEILISTCRPDYHRKYLENILTKNKIAYDYILFYTKPRVDLYVDDKGFRFVDWDTTVNWIVSKLPPQNVNHADQEPNTEFENILRKNKIKPLGDLTKYKNILDFGCGTGNTFVGMNLSSLDGYDINENYLNECRKKNIYRNLYSSLNNVNPKKYDLVCVLGVLEHIEDLNLFTSELNDFDRLYFTVPNAKSFHRVLGKNMGLIKNVYELSNQDYQVGHKTYYDVDSFCSDLNNYFPNYKIQKLGSTTFKFLPNKEMMSFENNISFLETTATECGLCGENNFFGAELYCLLERY